MWACFLIVNWINAYANLDILSGSRLKRAMEYKAFEAALADLHVVDADDMKAFRARLRVLRDMGVPAVSGPGKGSRIDYSFGDLWETALALALERFGLPPARATEVVEDARNSDLLSEVKKKERRHRQDIWLNLGLLAFEPDTDRRHRLILPTVKPLEFIFADLKDSETPPDKMALLRGLLNLSLLTRNCKTAITQQ
jgi:hypothetical protein